MQNTELKLEELNKYYITPEYSKKNEKLFFEVIDNALKDNLKIIQFRSKNISKELYKKIALKISDKCENNKALFIINGYENYNKDISCRGIQFTAKDITNLDFSKIHKNNYFFGSCHNENEVDICNRNNFDLILLSPVKDTKDKSGFGWKRFKELASRSSTPVFALGGLNFEKDIHEVEEKGGRGIAATSYFYDLYQDR